MRHVATGSQPLADHTGHALVGRNAAREVAQQVRLARLALLQLDAVVARVAVAHDYALSKALAAT